MLARLYPVYRNTTLRLLEPMMALEEENPVAQTLVCESQATNHRLKSVPHLGVCIALRDLSVVAAGHTILEEINLTIEPGSHVAIVGPSGAGKSSLVGLLLGWHRAASGQILVDGLSLEGPQLEQLRRQTVWVDPSVQLWNRSLIENLRYGAPNNLLTSIGGVIAAADLGRVLEQLPDGLQTTLGEGGALVSGGEGQRVRFGRALLRPDIRLVILDESFRGLDRESRRDLLARARNLWPGATLLCITHDLSETLSFGRVLVVDGGKIVEDGTPSELSEQPSSRYQDLLQAEQAVRRALWSGVAWRRMQLDKGHLREMNGDDLV
jgi:ABC-type multidrug transport system fused ATPase/permease subunit